MTYHETNSHIIQLLRLVVGDGDPSLVTVDGVWKTYNDESFDESDFMMDFETFEEGVENYMEFEFAFREFWEENGGLSVADAIRKLENDRGK